MGPWLVFTARLCKGAGAECLGKGSSLKQSLEGQRDFLLKTLVLRRFSCQCEGSDCRRLQEEESHAILDCSRELQRYLGPPQQREPPTWNGVRIEVLRSHSQVEAFWN